ncbi:unnamed protein product [Onchocerca ochengi]|uniref:HABP4_PAI-RBP1 domain-containing protein n=1 Tax=Onchocerca ochengi TaxID=42157 RepID=A0A182DYW4_ONCOC|nr:unnamed protein product [Onchocerca ochengi]
MVNRMPEHKITVTEKNSKDPNNGRKEEKTENGFTKPRRNKDRPERAIYQPGAVRRRAAALAASGSNSTEKIASASEEKP